MFANPQSFLPATPISPPFPQDPAAAAIRSLPDFPSMPPPLPANGGPILPGIAAYPNMAEAPLVFDSAGKLFNAAPATPRSPTRQGVSHGHQPPANIVTAAQAAQRKWGVPTSVTLAQWALESHWGHGIPTGSNNPFGIKARAGEPFIRAWTTEQVRGKSVRMLQNFRKFQSLDDAMEHRAALLATGRPYRKARKLMDDPDAFADALTGSYATAAGYGGLLKSVMKGSNLYQYDLPHPPPAR